MAQSYDLAVFNLREHSIFEGYSLGFLLLSSVSLAPKFEPRLLGLPPKVHNLSTNYCGEHWLILPHFGNFLATQTAHKNHRHFALTNSLSISKALAASDFNFAARQPSFED